MVNQKPFRPSRESQVRILRLKEKLFFNKKFREKLKIDSRKTLKIANEFLEETPLIYGKLRNQARNYRLIAESLLRVVNVAEKHYKFYEQKGEFFLFKNKDKYIFHSKILRDNKIRCGNLVFPNGLPNHTFKKAFLYKKVAPPSKSEWLDFGRYYFKQTNYNGGYLCFRGQKEKYFFDFVLKKILDKRKTKFELKCKLSKKCRRKK
jgi:hypothetical protein